MNAIFSNNNTFLIDEKVSFFTFSKNSYQVYNEKAEKIAYIKQKMTVWQQVLRVFVNKKRMPFLLEILDQENNLQASISRGWTFWMSNIKILDNNNSVIGTIQRKFSLKPTFIVLNNFGNETAQITGDYYAWDFVIKGIMGTSIGAINKKWAGLSKELFTSADKYIVTIDPNYISQQNRTLILSTAIVIDMILKNNK